MAFGLEKFDGIGAFRRKDEHGNLLREDGEILFPGSKQSMPYKSIGQMMNLLADSDRVKQTMTWKVTQWAVGRPLREVDLPLLDKIHRESQRHGGTYSSLITAIVLSELVQTTRMETTGKETTP